MNQIVHIFRKDCRRLWKVIFAVLMFTVLYGYGEVIREGAGTYVVRLSPYTLLLILVGLSGVLLPIMLFLLVVFVIQEESLVGSDKFWLTRPYDRRSLALEKLLFVLLWAFLPMLLHDVWLVRHFGFSLSSASSLLLWKNSQFAFFLLIAAAVAVLSASFARAVLVAIAAIVSAVLIFLVVLQNSGGPPTADTSATLAILAVLALAAVGAVCVIGFQYRFRITAVAALVGLIAILACALLARFWPSSLTASLSNRYAPSQLRAVQLIPDASLTGLTRPPALDNADNQARSSYYPFRAVGLPSDLGIVVYSSSADFVSPGHKQTIFYLAQLVRFQPVAASSLFADAGSPDQLVPFMVGQPDDPKPLKDTDGALSGKLDFEGFRSSVAKVPVPLPYQPQHFAVGGRRCTVHAGHRDAGFILRFDCVELEPGNTSRMQVHLLQSNQEIIPQGTSGQTSSQSGWPAFTSPIITTNISYQFSPDVSAQFLAGEPPRDREMVVYVEESLGRQERPFRIEHFRPGDLSLEAWQQRGVLTAPQHHLAPFVLPPGAHPSLTR